MKIRRWAILTAIFTFLGGAIVASGCQPSNTASTNNLLATSQDETTNCDVCNNCSVAGKSYNCNNEDERNAYIGACTANCEYNGKVYDCTTATGLTLFWCALGTDFGCQMCQGCLNGGGENSSTSD